jgi:hypothetical protein
MRLLEHERTHTMQFIRQRGDSSLDPFQEIGVQPLLVREQQTVRRAVVYTERARSDHGSEPLAGKLERSRLILRSMEDQSGQRDLLDVAAKISFGNGVVELNERLERCLTTKARHPGDCFRGGVRQDERTRVRGKKRWHVDEPLPATLVEHPGVDAFGIVGSSKHKGQRGRDQHQSGDAI